LCTFLRTFLSALRWMETPLEADDGGRASREDSPIAVASGSKSAVELSQAGLRACGSGLAARGL